MKQDNMKQDIVTAKSAAFAQAWMREHPMPSNAEERRFYQECRKTRKRWEAQNYSEAMGGAELLENDKSRNSR